MKAFSIWATKYKFWVRFIYFVICFKIWLFWEFWLTAFNYWQFFWFLPSSRFWTDFEPTKKTRLFLRLLIAIRKRANFHYCFIKENNWINRQFQNFCVKLYGTLKDLSSYSCVVLKKSHMGKENKRDYFI